MNIEQRNYYLRIGIMVMLIVLSALVLIQGFDHCEKCKILVPNLTAMDNSSVEISCLQLIRDWAMRCYPIETENPNMVLIFSNNTLPS